MTHLPDHALPGRGRRALRPDLHHGLRLVVAEGTPDELKRVRSSGDVLVVGVGAGNAAAATKLLDGESFVHKLGDRRTTARCASTSTTAPPPFRTILRTLDGAGIPLSSIELHRPSLDDVFLTKTGRSLRES